MPRIACALMLGCALAASASAAPVNLLRNGDFESGGPSGWITWRAPWGQQEQWRFNDTTEGRSGNYNLRISALGSSFGVYQTVAVTPGKSYRIEAKWKFELMSDPTWSEIEVLQGYFDLQQADQRPYDLPNKMYSFDSPENPPVAFDWLQTPVLNGTAADINQYRGIRKATGTRLTVVLKAGGNPAMNPNQSVVAWFDDVKLYEVPEPGAIALAAIGSAFIGRRRREPANG